MEMTIDSMAEYPSVLNRILEYGDQVSPRAVKTREISPMTICLTDPRYSYVASNSTRKPRYEIGHAEGLQLIAGESHPDLMIGISQAFEKFTDGGAWFHGAYGPRIRNQIPKIIRLFMDDVYTRQAVITIWDPNYDGYGNVRDTPCTVQLQFLYRNGALDMHVSMRSNDAWLGFPYDIMQFTMLQYHLADTLGWPLGHYYHHTTSFHLYETNFAQAESVWTNHGWPGWVNMSHLHLLKVPYFLDDPLDRWAAYRAQASLTLQYWKKHDDATHVDRLLRGGGNLHGMAGPPSTGCDCLRHGDRGLRVLA